MEKLRCPACNAITPARGTDVTSFKVKRMLSWLSVGAAHDSSHPHETLNEPPGIYILEQRRGESQNGLHCERLRGSFERPQEFPGRDILHGGWRLLPTIQKPRTRPVNIWRAGQAANCI